MTANREILNVEIDPKLTSPDAPYSVYLDIQRCLELFHCSGLTDEEIRRVRIRIVKERPRMIGIFAQAHYINFIKLVSVYSDPVWGAYRRRLQSAERMVKGEIPPWRSWFAGVRNSTELIKVLTGEPSEQALDFARSFLLSSTNNDLSASLAHEMRHAADFTRSKAWFERALSISAGGFGGAALGVTMGISPELLFIGGVYIFSNALDPNEVRARRAERTYQQTVGGYLITIAPNIPLTPAT